MRIAQTILILEPVFFSGMRIRFKALWGKRWAELKKRTSHAGLCLNSSLRNASKKNPGQKKANHSLLDRGVEPG